MSVAFIYIQIFVAPLDGNLQTNYTVPYQEHTQKFRWNNYGNTKRYLKYTYEKKEIDFVVDVNCYLAKAGLKLWGWGRCLARAVQIPSTPYSPLSPTVMNYKRIA
jgi:hypothetical protein